MNQQAQRDISRKLKVLNHAEEITNNRGQTPIKPQLNQKTAH